MTSITSRQLPFTRFLIQYSLSSSHSALYILNLLTPVLHEIEKKKVRDYCQLRGTSLIGRHAAYYPNYQWSRMTMDQGVISPAEGTYSEGMV